MVFQTIPDFPRTRDRFPMILLDNNTYSQKNKPLLPPPLKQLENLLILPVKVSKQTEVIDSQSIPGRAASHFNTTFGDVFHRDRYLQQSNELKHFGKNQRNKKTNYDQSIVFCFS